MTLRLLLLLLLLGFFLFIFVLTISFVLGRTSTFVEALETDIPRDASGKPITRDASGNILVFDASWAVVPKKESSLGVAPRYNPDNFDLTYHELTPYGDIYNTKLGEITVMDKSGQMMLLPYAKSQSLPVYYDPATTQKADIKSFVPSYTESVLLSNASTPPPVSTKKAVPVSHTQSYNFSLSVHP